MSHLDQDDYEAIGALVEQKLHTEEKKYHRPPSFKRWCRHCVVMALVFGLGIVIQHFIEDAQLRQSLHSVELALTALYAFAFERVKDMA